MHEEYDNYDDYDDNEDYPENKYKHYFKFDPQAWDAWGKWLYDAMNDIVESSPNVWYTMPNIQGWPKISFPVNSYFSDTGKGNSFQYLGSNYYSEPVFKNNHFVSDKLKQEYTLHLRANAAHFLKMPNYYKSLFDIMN
jgi:hypothetical protein